MQMMNRNFAKTKTNLITNYFCHDVTDLFHYIDPHLHSLACVRNYFAYLTSFQNDTERRTYKISILLTDVKIYFNVLLSLLEPLGSVVNMNRSLFWIHVVTKLAPSRVFSHRWDWLNYRYCSVLCYRCRVVSVILKITMLIILSFPVTVHGGYLQIMIEVSSIHRYGFRRGHTPNFVAQIFHTNATPCCDVGKISLPLTKILYPHLI